MNANDTNKSNNEIIYPKLSYKITGLLFEAHNKLGRFCREKQYCDELENIFKQNNLYFERESTDKNSNRFDFIVEENQERIIIEIKAKTFITKEDYYQLNRYLETNKIKLGLLVNFRSKYLKPKRIINAKY